MTTSLDPMALDRARALVSELLDRCERRGFVIEMDAEDLRDALEALAPVVRAAALLERWPELTKHRVWSGRGSLAEAIGEAGPVEALRGPLRDAWLARGNVDGFLELARASSTVAAAAWLVPLLEEVACARSTARDEPRIIAAAFALSELGPRAAPALIRRARLDRALGTPPPWRDAVLRRLAQVRVPGTWPTILLGTLASGGGWPAADVASVIDDAALPWLVRFAASPALTSDMVTAIGAIDSADARASLRETLAHPDPFVGLRSALALHGRGAGVAAVTEALHELRRLGLEHHVGHKRDLATAREVAGDAKVEAFTTPPRDALELLLVPRVRDEAAEHVAERAGHDDVALAALALALDLAHRSYERGHGGYRMSTAFQRVLDARGLAIVLPRDDADGFAAWAHTLARQVRAALPARLQGLLDEGGRAFAARQPPPRPSLRDAELAALVALEDRILASLLQL